MGIFDQFLESNRAFWGRTFPRASGGSNGYALIDASVNESYLLYGILKVGLIFAKIHGLHPMVFPYLSTLKSDRRMIDSMCARSINVKWALLRQLILKGFPILHTVTSIRSKGDILNIRISGIPVGPYIYDQCYVPGTEAVTLRMLIRIFYSALCFYVDEAVIKGQDIKLVVIGDPMYRGFLFELCKAHHIKCINAINIGTFQMHKYYDLSEFENSCRFVSPGMLNRLPDSPQISEHIERYFEERFAGSIQMHDVLRAFSPKKRILTKDQLYREYALEPQKPLAVLMAHCFKDTPHATPRLLYRDYEEWTTRSIAALKRNGAINVLVKEHPACDLYGEEGFLKALLESLGMGHALLKDDVHTRTIVNEADFILTCGGTIGAEAAAFGKTVVIAAQPPYAKKGFTVEPRTAAEYESILSKTIHALPALSRAQSWAAKKTAFILLSLYDNSDTGMELGGIHYVLGEDYDLSAVHANVISENRVPLEQQNIYRRLSDFHHSEDVSIINYHRLQSISAVKQSNNAI